MALTQTLRQQCPTCGKVALEESRSKVFSATLVKLACGHVVSEQALGSKSDAYTNIVSADGKRLMPYQIDGVKFFEENNVKGILADQQGLGKTVQALALLRLHPEKLLPCILVVPTKVKVQWLREIHRWCCPNDTVEEKRQFLTQVIYTGKEKAMPGFNIYITTYDILKKDDVFSFVPNINTIIIDECQRIKNHLSDRAKAIQGTIRRAKIEHRLPMSGTPIKNNAGEYYTVLNIVDERQFNNYAKFIENDCDSYHNGWGYKVGGLKNPEQFHEKTKHLILRRTKEQVLKDLPAKDRKFFHVDLDPKLNKAYAAALEELEELYYGDDNSFAAGSAKIAIMSRMRHITGVSKVDDCLEFVTEFLQSTDRRIVIFTHHQDVMDMLEIKLKQWVNSEENAGITSAPIMLRAGTDGTAQVDAFRNNESRIMIASTLSAGEGINLQFCSDAVMLERQWNPANEEQAEDRFHRFGQENKVDITYMIASGTIDEYFTELVETKRSIVASTMDNKEIKWDESSLMQELTQMLVTKGRQRWSL